MSEADKLRRERQRLFDTGISQIARAEEADVTVTSLQGDLFVQHGDGDLEQITATPTPALDPKPSPDGLRVAFIRDDELYVLELRSRREIQLSFGAEEGLSHGLAEYIAQEEMGRKSGYWWSPDGERIAYQETDERHVPRFPITRQDREQCLVETHRYPFSGMPNAKVRLGVVDARGGDTFWLAPWKIEGDFYLARVAWDSPRTLLVQILARDQKSLRLLRIDVDTGKQNQLLQETSSTWINLHDDLRMVYATGEFVWSSESTGFRHLELRDKGGDLVRTLTSGDWTVDGVAGLDAQRREVWFMGRREGPLETHLYRVSLDGGPIEQITSESGMHSVCVDRAGDHFIDTYSSLSAPPRTTLRDRAGKILAMIDDASEDPHLREVNLVPPRMEKFRNREGFELYGAYYAPRSDELKVQGKVPLVVLVYGGPHVQMVTHSWALTADMIAQFLSDLGFAVWKMDNRGSANRGHAFESSVHLRMGNIEVADQADGVAHICGVQCDLDTRRVGITGRSFGGYLTLRALTEAPDIFHAGVASAPVSDWRFYDTCYTERYMGMPADNVEGYRRSSVLSNIDRISGPLLIVHGMLDENVHFRNSVRLATALIEADRHFCFVPLPEERHSVRSEGVRAYVAEKIGRFFSMTLGTSPINPRPLVV
jgi:dipeptidyl-peptidase-4